MAERTKVSKTERLLNLISLMLRSRTPVPFADIAGSVVGYNDGARLDSIEKRFDRDKAELRNMGIPIDYVDTGLAETSGYVIPRDKFFLKPLQIDHADALLLTIAGRSGGVSASSPLMRSAFESAIRKLSVDMPEVNQALTETPSVLQISSGHEKAGRVLRTFCAAVYSRRSVRFRYEGRLDEAPKARAIDPYGLGISRGEWYAVGRCQERDAIRMFKLARIVGDVSPIGPSDSSNEFKIPVGFRMDDHLHREPWAFGEGDPVTVRVRLPREVALQMSHQSGLEFKTVSDDDGFSLVEFPAKSPARMINWIISLGPDARLLGPDSLIEDLKNRLDQLASLYTVGAGA